MELTCPKCHGVMRSYERNGVVVDQCTGCRGIFLDRGELETLLDAEAAYNARTGTSHAAAHDQRREAHREAHREALAAHPSASRPTGPAAPAQHAAAAGAEPRDAPPGPRPPTLRLVTPGAAALPVDRPPGAGSWRAPDRSDGMPSWGGDEGYPDDARYDPLAAQDRQRTGTYGNRGGTRPRRRGSFLEQLFD